MTPLTDEMHRRQADAHDPDKTDEEILALIRDAKNDEVKGHLIVLYQINRSHIKMATLLSEVVNRLETQEKETKEHRDLVTKGIGAWRAIAISMAGFVLLLGIAGSLVVYIWAGAMEDQKKIAKESAEQTMRLVQKNSEQDTRIGVLENNPPISRESDKRLTILENNLKDSIGQVIDNRQRLGELERAFNRVLEQRARPK